MNAPPAIRLLLAVPAIVALVVGVLSGLARLGIAMPEMILRLVPVHGALMIGVFFGGLIGLERAVAAGRLAAYVGPALSGLAGLLLIASAPVELAAAIMTFASLAMSVLCWRLWRRQAVAHHAALAAAAAAWLAGNAIWWLTGTLYLAVPLWISFLVLTIAAERLELSRFAPRRPGATASFAAIVVVMWCAAAASGWWPTTALKIFALALAALALWLLRHDIARRTIRTRGLTRYMAVCLLSGYVWLAIGAGLGAAGAFLPGSPWRDAALHALLMGFVFSMVFAHAPVILPALAKVRFAWHSGFYLPLLLLHGGLALRVASVPLHSFDLRQLGGQANAGVLALFVVFSVAAVRRKAQRPPR